ncbi:MAG: hypothetical protein VX066_04145 [Pseudomonadota bacterium]|nr:hypothetical protein [Pseudomonadota bacterium]
MPLFSQLDENEKAQSGLTSVQLASALAAAMALVDSGQAESDITRGIAQAATLLRSDLSLNIAATLGAGFIPTWDHAQFDAAIAAGSCTVLYVGTSITDGTLQAENSNSWVNRANYYLQLKYPTVDFTFVNLGIPSRRLEDYVNPAFQGVAAEPGNARDGYMVDANPDTWPTGSTIGQTWMAAAEAVAPDLLIIHHGMNDRGSVDDYYGYLTTALTNAQGWSTPPSIALATEMAPYAQASYFEDIANYSNLTRWFALANNLGVIDFGRAAFAVSTNVDHVKCAAYRQSSIAAWQVDGATGSITDDSLSTTASSQIRATLSDQNYAGARFAFTWTPDVSTANFALRFHIREDLETDGSFYVFRTASNVYVRRNDASNEAVFAVGNISAGVAEDYDIRVKRNVVEVWRNAVLLGRAHIGSTTGRGGCADRG